MWQNRLQIITKIVERADEMDLIRNDRLTLMMDLKLADQNFNIKLKELLEADAFNFSHDIFGIQDKIDRTNKIFDEYFIPRYAEEIQTI